MNTIIVKVNNKVETIAEHTVVLKNETPTVIKAVNRTNYELLDTTVNRAPNNVVTKRVDNNLHISFENDGQGPDLIIEGFYDSADSALIGIAEDGNYYYYLPDTGEVTDYVTELRIGEAQSQLLGGDSQISPWWVGATEAEGFAALPWLLGLAGVGIAGAALSGGGDSDNSSSSDNTAPAAPTIDTPIAGDNAVNGDEAEAGFAITGTGEPGATITLTNGSSNVIGTSIVNSDGTWSVAVNEAAIAAMGEGPETITATATDLSNNVSTPTTADITVDTMVPAAPTVTVNADGTEITGTGEPGATVEIDTNGDGIPEYTATVDENGDYTVDTSGDPLIDGETVTATATDPAGNTSEPSSTAAPGDDTAPAAPTIDTPIAGDNAVNGDEAEAGFAITGTGEPGATITLTNGSSNVIGTSIVNSDGTWSVAVNEAAIAAMGEGPETITATATDLSNNVSTPTTADITVDTMVPAAPTVTVNADGTEITGTGEPGATVEIDTNGDGIPEYTATVDENGDYTVDTSGDPLINGETVTATVTDPAGNTSEPSLTAAPGDDTAPAAPTIDTPIAGDNAVNGDEAEAGFAITGTGEPGATITLTNGSSNVIGTSIVNSDGTWSVAVNEAAIAAMGEGPETITATATDLSNNVSTPTTADITVDTMVPAAPTVTVNADGTEITGTGEPGATVEIDTNGDGIPEYTATVDENGDYTVDTSGDPLINGETVTATVTDPAGNTSEPSLTAAPGDETAPAAPMIDTPIAGDNAVNGDEAEAGFAITGTGEPGATITLTNGSSNVIGTSIVNSDGTWSVAVNEAAIAAMGEGPETITATATDLSNNVSTPTTAEIIVDTMVPGGEEGAAIVAPVVVIDDEADDGVNAEEFADGVQTQVTLPTGTVAGDMITLTVTPEGGTAIAVEYAVTELDVTTGSADVTIANDADNGITAEGNYSVTATVTDEAGNVSAPSAAVDFHLNPTFIARDDLDDLDLGALQVTYYDPISESDLDVLGVAEGTGGADSSLGFTVSAGTNGTVSIEVSQTALVTVADAINVEVYNSNNELVYVGTTGSEPLVGNVIGIELLGLTGNDTLTATVSGLEPDNYTIVVRNDESALGALVNGLTLAELGEAGVVLGPDNQEVVFTTINNALGPVLGGTVNGLLNIALTTAGDEGLGLDAVVDILEDNVLGLGVLDPLFNDITAVLLSNTLTLFETTDITATVTEFDYADDTVITGNVIDPDASSSGESGEDTVTVDTVLTDIDSNNTQSQPTSDVVNGITVFTIQGQYGILVINENGDYTYTANGDFASSGQSETFIYTVSDGVISDTAELVINLDAVVDTTPPDAPTINEPIAGDNIVNGTEAAASFAVTGTGVSGDTITLTDGSNNVLGTAIVNAAGDWSINVDEAEVTAMGEGAEQLSATATDPAGNTSVAATATITVDTTAPIAFDNEVTLDIGFESSTTNVPLKSASVGGLLNLGLLADTINVGLLSGSNVLSFNVAENTTQQVTVDGSGDALANLSVIGDPNFDLIVYKDNGDGFATEVQTVENWLVYQPGELLPIPQRPTWSANDLALSEFEGGDIYYVTLGNNGGLLDVSLLSSLTIRTTLDEITSYNPPATVIASTAGNVITDIGADGTDVITSGTVVSSVNGLSIEVDGRDINGIYGTLTINPDGSYNYVANESFTGAYGDVDRFEYTITADNGESSTASLDITLDYNTNSGTFAARSISLDESFTLAIDDAIEIPDTSLITSTEGLDILSFEGADQVISLADMMQPDIIDIDGIGANTLNVAVSDVESAIYIRGDSDDTVDLKGDSWSNVEQTASGGEVYNVWQSADDVSTQIFIDNNVNII
ncbi:hypothetical protein IEE84_07895 [Psychrobacter sp. 28M-43]|uniref:Ig-like domain-containing protein n=1 Tax=Psychrobacter sp. 28M-43 TaxID=2772254 RepID=UPI00168D416F|nr:Ig-like domain-containing protein [Psychrobacter sp. 28M-43]QOD11838.1 hypothetical protein IEE84_07895 [Psychrobacter sp. 28M-43]